MDHRGQKKKQAVSGLFQFERLGNRQFGRPKDIHRHVMAWVTCVEELMQVPKVP